MCLVFKSDCDFEVVFLDSSVDFKTLSLITIRKIIELGVQRSEFLSQFCH